MRNNKVVISIGESVYSNKVIQKKLTIDQLFDKFTKPKIRKKKDGPYFIFASIKGNERNAANIKFYYGATLDLDTSNMSSRQIRKVLKPLNCWYAIYTTHSHKIKGNRYRVVIPYSDPVSKQKHVETTIYLNAMFGIDGVDTSSKALSRPMYFPACPQQTEKHFFFYESRSHKLFNPDDKVKLEPAQLWALEELKRTEKDKVDITAEIVEGDRNNHIARIAGTLIQQGKTLVEVLDYCDEVNQLKLNPPLIDRDVKTIVQSVWKSHTRNHNDCDWGYSQIKERIQKEESLEANLDHIIGIISNSILNKKTSSLQRDKLLNLIKKKTGDSVVTLRKEITDRMKTSNEESKTFDLETNDIDESFINKIRKEFKDYYLVTSSNLIYNRKFDMSYKIEGFNNSYSYLQQDLSSFKVTPFRLLQQIGCMQSVDKVDYRPGEEKIFKDGVGMICLNTYNKPTVIPAKGKTKILRKHFDYLFNEEDQNIVLDFIAFNYQYPGHKVRWMPVIKGKKRIGKSIIGNKIIAPIFGSNNIRQMGNSQPLLEKFNAWQTGAQMVIIHELFISNRLDQKKLVTENIKSFITDEYLMVRKMHSDGIQTLNTTNGMAFTNHEDSLYVTDDEERFCMIRCEVHKRTPFYYRRLIEYLDSNKPVIADFFNTRKIRHIDPNTLPMNEYTREVMQSSLNWAEDIVKEAIVYKNPLFTTQEVLTWNTICDYVMENITESDIHTRKIDQIYNMGSSQGRMLKQALIEIGFRIYTKDKKDRFRINGKLDRLWITRYGKNKGAHNGHVDMLCRKAIHAMELLQKVKFEEELRQADGQ